MSTRSITTFIDNFTGEEIVAVYRHADGFPSGHETQRQALADPEVKS